MAQKHEALQQPDREGGLRLNHGDHRAVQAGRFTLPSLTVGLPQPQVTGRQTVGGTESLMRLIDDFAAERIGL